MPVFEVLTTFTDWLLKITFNISFCILLVLLVRCSFARIFGARLTRILWLLVFVRCLVPWSFSVGYHPASFLSELSTIFDNKPISDIAQQASGTVTIVPNNISDSDSTIETNEVLPARDKIFTAEMLRAILAGLWFFGLLIFFSLALFRNKRILHLATNTTQTVPPWLQEIFIDCRERARIKIWSVLVISSCFDSPGLIGAVRPRILLPYNLVRKNNREQLQHILMHELVHIKQGDIWLSWFWAFLCFLQWFNPLIWWSGRYMYLDREMACDERVLRLLKSEKRSEYSRSLIDLFQKVNLPARCPGLAGVVERKTNIERRLGMIERFKIVSIRQTIVGIFSMIIILALSLTSFADSESSKLTSEKAELMGRVEDFFLHNFRDITARKSLEWGQPENDKQKNQSIRYMYEAQIWEKDWKIVNQVFTFDKDGQFVDIKEVSGYPKDKQIFKADTSTEEGMKALVERFFSRNFRDITARNTIEWGKATTEANGNRSIRYKYEASSWGINKRIYNQKFIFNPDGEFVSVEELDILTSNTLSEPKQSDFSVYKCDKKVSDYPKENDLSTPEAAYSTIMRNYMAAGASMDEWSEISVRTLRGSERTKVSDETAKSYLNAHIIEVRIFKDRLARVFAEMENNGTTGYDQRSLFLHNGCWLNSGHDGAAPTLEEARDTFTRKCARMLNSNLAIVRE